MEPHEYDLMYDIEQSYWWYLAKRELVVGMVREWIRPGAPIRLLDVGCGTGANLLALRPFGDVVGCDTEPAAVRYAQSRGLADIILQPDPGRLPFPDAAFDVVTLLEVLEHADDDVGLLREIRRVLRPGGHLLITVPALPVLWSVHDEAAHHRRRYRTSELLTRLRESGLEVERASHLNAFLLPLIVPVRWLRSVIVRRRGETTSDFHVHIPRPLNSLFRWIFASEWTILRHGSLPIGLSLSAVARRGPETGDA